MIHKYITQFTKLAAGEQFCRRCTHRKLWHFKHLKVSSEKSQILSCDIVVANERYLGFSWFEKLLDSLGLTKHLSKKIFIF